MAKTKSDVNAKAKKSVATNAMFNKVEKEVRQAKPHHAKDAIGKSAKASKGSKAYKSKHKAKHIPEHPLAAEFAGKTDLIE